MSNRPEDIFKEETIDFKKYLFLILRNWYWFAISIFFGLFVAYYVNRFSEPIYRVGASVIVRNDQRAGGLTGAEQLLEGMEIFKTTKSIENEIEILKSYEMARRALSELDDFEVTYEAVGRFKNSKMYNRAEIILVPTEGFNQLKNYPIHISLLSKDKYRLQINDKKGVDKVLSFGEKFENRDFSFQVLIRESDLPNIPNEEFTFEKYIVIFNDFNRLVNQYRSRLSISVNNERRGSVLFLSTQGYNSRQEVDYINKLVDVYIRSGLEEKNQIATQALEFIEEQLLYISDSLRKSENALQAFRSRYQIMDLSREGQAVFTKIERLQQEKASLEIKAKYFDYLFTYLKNKTQENNLVAPSLMGIPDPLLNSLVSQMNSLYFERKMLSYGSRENSPGILQINQKIESVSEALLENVTNLIRVNQLSVTDNNRLLRLAENELMKLPVTEREFINIERKFNLNNNLYTYLLQKRAEVGIARASNIADNRVLDYARAENAATISPKRSRNYMLSIVFGIGLPLIIIFLLDFFNNKIREKKDIENKTSVPILATIGHNSIDYEYPVFEKPRSSIAESFRALRTNLQYVLREEKSKVISITSTLSGEGKTFTAINLAIIIAMSGKKTLLVGLDLRKPKINKVFKLNKETGLSTYLIGAHGLEDAISPTFVDNLSVVTSGPIPPNPAELIQGEKMEEFINQMKKEFDYIIFDTPPVAIVTDAMILNKFCNLTVFVIRQNFSTRNVVELINELYTRHNFKNLSIVVNDIKTPTYYGYDYGYKYGYGYGYGYGYSDGDGYYSDEPERRGFFYRLRNLFG